PLHQITLLSESEQVFLLEGFNTTGYFYEDSLTVLDAFKSQALKTPDAPAVIFEERLLTYAELDKLTDKLGYYLKTQYTIASGDRIGLLLDRSDYVVISLLGILKSGGGYVPIDPETPEDRISMILEDAGVSLLISEMYYGMDQGSYHGPKFIIDVELDGLSEAPSDFTVSISSKDLAYMIYTSGTTGTPKGVCITHGNLYHYIRWASTTYVNDQASNFALFTSISFDLTVTSIFTPLVSGHSVVIYGNTSSHDLIRSVFTDPRVQVVKLTPSHLRVLQSCFEAGHSFSVNRFIIGGESLSRDLAQSIHELFRGHATLYNEYGPTEATVGCMLYEYSSEDTCLSVPIGVPIANMQAYVLDRHLAPVAIGVVGELYLSGAGLASGYHDRDSLTEDRFIPHPYQPGVRMYKTGDLVRHLSAGVIEFIGRNDDQVKIRGYRVELGEVTAHVSHHASVSEALVISTDLIDGSTELVAYVVQEDRSQLASLRSHLSGILPEYMVPRFYV
ncbi:amino acid adenylation domain-containing protein, partial [Ascidiimonas sp. W6]|uniref:non-ribosomal peptide synthetase n=1 Tax=Ascidiimonas meishanensis TaxID=3128903 RepID=UPI0030EE5F89